MISLINYSQMCAKETKLPSHCNHLYWMYQNDISKDMKYNEW